MSSDGQVPQSSRQRAPRRDGGFTFVETVLTVVLLGIVVVPVLAAVRGAIRVSTVSEAAAAGRDRARQRRRPRPAGTRAGGATTRSFAQAAAAAMRWDPGQITVEQEYLDPTVGWTEGPAAPLGSGPACPETGDQDGLAKRITITVASPDGLVRRHMQVVKSDV